MKKVILLICIGLSSLFGNSELSYVDLYGEIQVNMIVAEKCLEEVAYTSSLDGQQCALYTNAINTEVYGRLIKRKFTDFDSKNTYWTVQDWVILKNQMKKLIYVTNLIQQFKN